MDLWTKIAISIAVLVISSVLGISYYLPELDFRLVLLLTGLIFVGMPHGAMDIFLLYKTIGTGKYLLLSLLIYTGLALPILFLWPIFPTACFLFFLVYSLIHFTDSDMQNSGPLKVLEFFARVSLPFSLPYIFHHAETLKLVSWIHPNIDLSSFDTIISSFGYLGLVLVGLFTLIGAKKFFLRFPDEDMGFLEPLVLSVLFVFISPLYALAIYFCFIHSIKHLINVIARIEIKSIVTILPYWLIPLLGLPVIATIYAQNFAKLEASLFQYSLIVLSALALPHALLVRHAKSKGLLN